MAYSLQEEDFYHCSVCLDDMTERNPRLLACHHSFCEDCLVKLVKRGNIECPSCRHVTPVTNDDVTKFSKNFMLLGMKERENKLLYALKHFRFCHICNIEVTKYKCLDCNEMMCKRCTAKHSKSQRFTNHKVVVKCDIHNEGITHICEKCLKGVCCKCIVLNHSDHDDLVHDYDHGMELLHTNIEKLRSVFKKEVTSLELILQEAKRKILIENSSKKLLQEKRKKLLDEAAIIKKILDKMDTNHRKQSILHRDYEGALKTGLNILRRSEKLNKTEGDEFLIVYPGIKLNLETGLNKTNEVRMKYDSKFVPADFNLLSLISDQTINWAKKPMLIATFTKENVFLTLKCPGQVACLENKMLAIAGNNYELKVLIVNYNGKEIMSYNLSQLCHGYVTSVHSSDGKTLYIVQENCITSVCCPSINAKTYKTDLRDMKGMFVLDDTKFVIYSKTTVCEYEPETKKTKRVVRGLNNCHMCLPYIDGDTSTQRYIVIDDNEREDNIKVYNDRWNLTHSFGPHGSQDGMLDNPCRAVIVDGNLLVCDMYNHRVSCFTIKGEFICNVLTAIDGITNPFGIDFRFPFLWISEVNYPNLDKVKGYQYTE